MVLLRLLKHTRRFSDFLKYKTILNLPDQDITWSAEELKTNISAFKKGYSTFNLGKGDKVLFWMDTNHSAELITAKIGCMELGVDVHNVDNSENIIETINKLNPKFLFVSPNEIINNSSKKELLYKQLPSLKESKSNVKLDIPEAKSLQFIIQTGFYTEKGLTKFKDFMNYSKMQDNFESYPLSNKKVLSFNKKNGVTQSDNIIAFGNLNNQNLFEYAVLNSYLNNLKLTYISETFKKDIDYLNHFEASKLLITKEHENIIKGRYSNDNIKIINL